MTMGPVSVRTKFRLSKRLDLSASRQIVIPRYCLCTTSLSNLGARCGGQGSSQRCTWLVRSARARCFWQRRWRPVSHDPSRISPARHGDSRPRSCPVVHPLSSADPSLCNVKDQLFLALAAPPGPCRCSATEAPQSILCRHESCFFRNLPVQSFGLVSATLCGPPLRRPSIYIDVVDGEACDRPKAHVV